MYLSSVASCGNTFSDEISCLCCGIGVSRCVQASKIDCAIRTSSTKGRKEMADAIQGRISIPGLGPRDACRGALGAAETVTFLASAALVYARTLAASGQEP